VAAARYDQKQNPFTHIERKVHVIS